MRQVRNGVSLTVLVTDEWSNCGDIAWNGLIVKVDCAAPTVGLAYREFVFQFEIFYIGLAVITDRNIHARRLQLSGAANWNFMASVVDETQKSAVAGSNGKLDHDSRAILWSYVAGRRCQCRICGDVGWVDFEMIDIEGTKIGHKQAPGGIGPPDLSMLTQD